MRPNILLRNVYGWFSWLERGLYKLTPEGAAALPATIHYERATHSNAAATLRL
jgi:hypothetical protein